MNRPSEAMWIVAEGLLGENEEFLVYRWSLPTEASKAPASPDQAPLTSFYRPVAAATVPNAPLPAVAPAVPAATPTAAPAVPSATSSATPSKQIHCDVCGTGPFLSQLELQGHMSTAHPVKRSRKPGSKSSSITGSKKPEEPANVPTAPANVPTAPANIPTTPADTPTSTPVPFAASPEQATLPATNVPADVQALAQAPAGSVPTSVPTPEPVPAHVQAASEPAEKYTKLCGLVKKPLAEFKLHFEANFPGQDIAEALEAAHIVDDKVVFTGG
jgi:hypothetical protein